MDPKVGKLLEDAKSDALQQPGREEDRRLFFEEHIRECQACREAVIDHFSETVAMPLFQEIATKHGISVEEVLRRFAELQSPRE